MAKEKRSKAKTPVPQISEEQRKMVGQAIIEGLITPGSFSFINPLASEGGDYDQNGGPYTQSGGGSHDQGGNGGYDQSASFAAPGLNNQLDVINILDVLKNIRGLQ